MKKVPLQPKDAAESLAVQALAFIAQDAERLGRFLAVTGIGPGEIRAASGDPAFLAGVIDYLASDEQLIKDLAGETGIDPLTVEQARFVLGGGWEREEP